MPKVLLADDDPELLQSVSAWLEHHKWNVDLASDGAEAREYMTQVQYDVLVIDWTMPEVSGIELCQWYRSRGGTTPILILTGKDEISDKEKGLDSGADDYLTKPFSTGELLARVRALLRRAATMRDGEPATVHFGDVEVDRSRRLVTRAGQPVHLTDIEYRILLCLLANADRVVTQRHLLTEVWGQAYLERGHYLRIHISHLRQKLEQDSARPRFILTETGVGYRFMPPANAPD